MDDYHYEPVILYAIERTKNQERRLGASAAA
jgi:hypothetical protein